MSLMRMRCHELITHYKCFIRSPIMGKYLIKSGVSQTKDKQRNKQTKITALKAIKINNPSLIEINRLLNNYIYGVK